jgi:hypothetical protein
MLFPQTSTPPNINHQPSTSIMSAPATVAHKAAKSAKKREHKPYSRPPVSAPVSATGRPSVNIDRKALPLLSASQFQHDRLKPAVLANEFDQWADTFTTLGKVLRTDSGKKDTQVHHVARWYADQIEALEKKVPVLPDGKPLRVENDDGNGRPQEQKFEHWRQDTFGDHLAESEDDNEGEDEGDDEGDDEGGDDEGDKEDKNKDSKKDASELVSHLRKKHAKLLDEDEYCKMLVDGLCGENDEEPEEEEEEENDQE